AVLKSPHMLLFAGLTPLMGIANAIDGKRKGKRSDRGERERFARDLRDFEDRLRSLADEERCGREAASPDPAEILRRVTLPSVTLWERRPGDHDFLLLRAGVGTVPWEPPVGRLPTTADIPEELTAVLAE